MLRLLPFVFLLPLCACGSSANQPGRGEIFANRAELDTKDDAICRRYGAQLGTPVYIQCRVEQDKRRDDFRRE